MHRYNKNIKPNTYSERGHWLTVGIKKKKILITDYTSFYLTVLNDGWYDWWSTYGQRLGMGYMSR